MVLGWYALHERYPRPNFGDVLGHDPVPVTNESAHTRSFRKARSLALHLDARAPRVRLKCGLGDNLNHTSHTHTDYINYGTSTV